MKSAILYAISVNGTMKDYKNYIRGLTDNDFEELTKLAELDKDEYWLAYYALRKDRMAENTREKLSMSISTYFRKLLIVKTKLYYTIKFTK